MNVNSNPNSTVRKICVVGVLMVVAGVAAFYYFRRGSTPSVEQAAPRLVPFAELAKVACPVVTTKVGPAASVISLHDGARLEIPQNAISQPATLKTCIVDLDLQSLSTGFSTGRIYVVSSDRDIPKLGTPVILEIPKPTRGRGICEFDGKTWKPVKVVPGPKIRIELDHFSDRTIGVADGFGAWTGRSEELSEAIEDIDAAPTKTEQHEVKQIESGDANVKAFFGVGERAPSDANWLCREFQDLLSKYKDPKHLKFPSGEIFSNWKMRLGLFLHAAKTPKDAGGYYYEATKDSMETIHQLVIGSSGQLSPAQFLDLCIQANDGNVPLGVLAAHNYLKDLTYRGRDTYGPNRREIPPDIGRASQHLASWRGNNLVRNKFYDKMGPLYHVFAAMTASLWGGAIMGDAAVAGEAFLRGSRSGSDVPDREKGHADQCGANLGGWILDGMPASGPHDRPPDTVRPKPQVMSDKDLDERRYVVYALEGIWLCLGTGTDYNRPIKKRNVLWGGHSDDLAKKEILSSGDYIGRGAGLKALVEELTDIEYDYHPSAWPRETIAAKYRGTKYQLRLDFAIFDYNLGANIGALRSVNPNICPKKKFGKQCLVHATGHGTYSGPVKDDIWMMIPEKCMNKDGKGFTIADGMGGTFGYACDQVRGPFESNYELAPALREMHKQDKRVWAVGLYAADRSVDPDEVPEGVTPIDHGR